MRNILMSSIIKKFIANPIRFLKIAYRKIFTDPINYKVGAGYDAERYWRDRFKRYGRNIKGPGEEGASEKDNAERYKRVTKVFKKICNDNLKNFEHLKVLEIGPGTGLITEAIFELGVRDYLGVDITDALFTMLREKFPSYKFSKLDISTTDIKDKYDLIVIIDVIEHIVEDEKFIFAMNNLKNSLLENGSIVIAPIVEKKRRVQFYERHWSLDDLRKNLPDFKYSKPLEWEKNFSKIFFLTEL